MNHSVRSRPFFPIVGFALARAVLGGIVITVLLLLFKGFAAYQMAQAGGGNSPDFVSVNPISLIPFYLVMALLVVGAFIVAVVMVTALLNFTVPPYAKTPSAATGIAYIISFIVIIPTQVGAFFFQQSIIDSDIGHFTSYLSYFLIPSILLLFLAIVTAHHIRRLTHPAP